MKLSVEKHEDGSRTIHFQIGTLWTWFLIAFCGLEAVRFILIGLTVVVKALR